MKMLSDNDDDPFCLKIRTILPDLHLPDEYSNARILAPVPSHQENVPSSELFAWGGPGAWRLCAALRSNPRLTARTSCSSHQGRRTCMIEGCNTGPRRCN